MRVNRDFFWRHYVFERAREPFQPAHFCFCMIFSPPVRVTWIEAADEYLHVIYVCVLVLHHVMYE